MQDNEAIGSIMDYATYRLSRAKEDLDAAELLFVHGDYRKEGIFPVELSAMIGSAFTIRNASDYDDMFIASKADTEQQIKNAKRIYEEVEAYVKDKLNEKNKGKKWCQKGINCFGTFFVEIMTRLRTFSRGKSVIFY